MRQDAIRYRLGQEVSLYQWWVFVHLVGVFGLLASHGVSMVVTFQLRKERDPSRVGALLQLSSSSISAFYVSMGLLGLGGVVAAFQADLWGYGWIWASIIALLAVSVAMYALARPYYERLRFVTTAIVEGSKAVRPEQYQEILRSKRPLTVAVIGIGGLVLLLYLMLFKPTLGLSPADATRVGLPPGPTISLMARSLAFETDELTTTAARPFSLIFHNQDAGLQHNVAILDGDGDVEFRGELFSGPDTVTYNIPALGAGSYDFVCDIHPQQMTGVLVVR